MRGYSRPEFLYRLDDIVLFEPLTEVQIEHIVSLMFNDLRARLTDRRVTLELTENARRYIAERAPTPCMAHGRCGGLSPAKSRLGLGARCWPATSATVR